MDLEQKIDKIITILTNIETRLDKIEENLNGIKEDNKVVEKDCLKMREHIDFVETLAQVAAFEEATDFVAFEVDFELASVAAKFELYYFVNFALQPSEG